MNSIGDNLTRDVLVYCFIGGLLVAVPTMCIAYTGVAVTRWIWKDKTV